MATQPKPARLVCGLGNSGSEFVHTRHNIGFATIDVLAEQAHVRYWKNECGCEVAEVELYGRTILLAKPQDFMNTCGGPLSKLARAHHIQPAELLVIHDEVDLAEGKAQAKFGGGLNAHNGLRSLSAKLNTRDFGRIRAGIGRPPGKMDVATYVLRELKGSYLEEFELLAQNAAACTLRYIEDPKQVL